MKASDRISISLLLGCAVLCGCQTTGDPTKGGLFGWNEEKAQERQAELEQTVARERAKAESEQQTADVLRRQVRINSADLDAQRKEISQLLADVAALERESPTPAAAARARRLGRDIDAARQDQTLTVSQRWKLLRKYSAEVYLMRAQAAGKAPPAL